MYYSRSIDKHLLEWRNQPHRKPLLIRGARQVGKSTAVRHLASSFKYFVEINLERDRAIQTLFADNIDVRKLCSQLSAIKGIPIVAGETLLFIDEIQESERAISSLRYFHEEYADLHVIAAGSLLEFALRELPSFGVGRISSMYMHPFSFDEFLAATGNTALAEYKNEQGSSSSPLPEAIHTALCDKLRTYYIVGGMPESVAQWVESSDYMQCIRIQHDMMAAFMDDFGKYHTRISPLALRNTLMSVARQIGTKFVYTQAADGGATSTVKEALNLLTLSGLITPVVHTAANGLPLGAEANSKYVKFLMLDSGLTQTMLNMPVADALLSNAVDFVNKGPFAEMFVGLELIKYSSPYNAPQLYYWQRLDKGALAEVDYVVGSTRDGIIPIEVKAGTRGAMQSLRQFMAAKRSAYGVRLCMENFGSLDSIAIRPLYAVSGLVAQLL